MYKTFWKPQSVPLSIKILHTFLKSLSYITLSFSIEVVVSFGIFLKFAHSVVLRTWECTLSVYTILRVQEFGLLRFDWRFDGTVQYGAAWLAAALCSAHYCQSIGNAPYARGVIRAHMASFLCSFYSKLPVYRYLIALAFLAAQFFWNLSSLRWYFIPGKYPLNVVGRQNFIFL